MSAHAPDPAGAPQDSRRSFLTSASTLTMAAGLAAGYGAFATALARFVYPAHDTARDWRFVCTVTSLPVGNALNFTSPSGVPIVVARQGDGETADDFLALSSVCPHLGCRVHWEGANDRFFCPCHNGAFDRTGQPTEGPPKSANQALLRFPLKVENGLLFISVPTQVLADGGPASDDSAAGAC